MQDCVRLAWKNPSPNAHPDQIQYISFHAHNRSINWEIEQQKQHQNIYKSLIERKAIPMHGKIESKKIYTIISWSLKYDKRKEHPFRQNQYINRRMIRPLKNTINLTLSKWHSKQNFKRASHIPMKVFRPLSVIRTQGYLNINQASFTSARKSIPSGNLQWRGL